MPDAFLHGVEVVEIDDGLRPIQTVKSSIIGLVGTAPDADAGEYPLDLPVLITGPRMAAGLGEGLGAELRHRDRPPGPVQPDDAGTRP